jgi:LacI family transcriptional regulator
MSARDRFRKSSNAVTMHAVAEHAGVSPMSVSNVINRRKVRPETREAVLRSIAALNYKPNIAAQALASASPLHIGLIYNSPESAFVSAMLVGALDASTKYGAQLLIRRYQGPGSGTLENALRDLIDGDGANALLLPAPHCEALSGTSLMRDLKIPLVALFPGSELPDMTSVRIDDVAAAYDMTMHLVALGHRRIGFIRAAENHIVSKTRYAGYLRALEHHGIAMDPRYVVDGDLTFDTGLEAAGKLLDLDRPPTAIFASNDDTAAAVVSVAHRRNIPIPEQLSVAGFDDSPISRKVWPQITTIRQPVVEMTSMAVEMLAHRFNNEEGEAAVETRYLPYELITRSSTASLTRP